MPVSLYQAAQPFNNFYRLLHDAAHDKHALPERGVCPPSSFGRPKKHTHTHADKLCQKWISTHTRTSSNFRPSPPWSADQTRSTSDPHLLTHSAPTPVAVVH